MAIVTVVGGANIDFQGFPSGELRPHDSNPGKIRLSAGGVGRNIAENLARLGVPVRFVSVFGEDKYGEFLLSSLHEAGVDTTLSLVLPGRVTSSYLCILGHDGRLHVAVADMEILSELSPKVLEMRADALAESDVCVVDTNLTEEALGRVVELCGDTPCLLDTVSVAKAVRATRVVGKFSAVKPNEAELEVLTGTTVTEEKDLDCAADILHRLGTGAVFVSLGERGLYFSDGKSKGLVDNPSVTPVNVSGAGDALTAALALGIVEHRPIEEIVVFAAASAALTTESAATVDKSIDLDEVWRLAATLRIRR